MLFAYGRPTMSVAQSGVMTSILFVDDCEVLLRLLHRSATTIPGVRLFTAKTANEARTIARQQELDAAVIDVYLQARTVST